MAIPMDIRTNTGTQRLTVDARGMSVTSEGWPVIDPEVFYLKRVIQE